MIKIKNATKLGYIEIIEGGVLDLSFPESKTRRGRVIDEGRTSPTLDTGCDVGVIQVCQVYGTDKEPNPSGGSVIDPEGNMRTLGGARNEPTSDSKAVPYTDTNPEKAERKKIQR